MQGVGLGQLATSFRRVAGWSSIDLGPSDMAIARAMSGLFWLIGALITALLLPWAPPTHEIGDAGWAVVVAGLAISLWVARRHLNPDVSLKRIYLAGYGGVLLVIALEWMAGGRDTPYHYLYMLPILFAAAAQSPRRMRDFSIVVAVVIWLPLLYEGTERRIVLDIATQLVTLIAVGTAVWILFAVLRMQRQTIRSQRQQAEMLARKDELTELGNRRAFSEALDREVARSRRGQRRLSVVVGDLDNFKEINDRHGHAAGDDALCLAADAVRQIARQADACFRWGGDEFAILLPEADREQAQGVAERLQSAIGDLTPPEGQPGLGITCGIAELSGTQAADSLIAEADGDLLSRKSASSRPS